MTELSGRADHNVRAGAPGTRRHVAQHAVAHADQREDHGDLNANRDDAEQSSHRTVLQIFENQTMDQRP